MCMSVQLATGDPEKQQIPLKSILQYNSHCCHGKIKLADVTVVMVTTTKMLPWQHIPQLMSLLAWPPSVTHLVGVCQFFIFVSLLLVT